MLSVLSCYFPVSSGFSYCDERFPFGSPVPCCPGQLSAPFLVRRLRFDCCGLVWISFPAIARDPVVLGHLRVGVSGARSLHLIAPLMSSSESPAILGMLALISSRVLILGGYSIKRRVFCFVLFCFFFFFSGLACGMQKFLGQGLKDPSHSCGNARPSAAVSRGLSFFPLK